MLDRVLEPEVMDSEIEVDNYNQMGHQIVNQVFAEDFLKALSNNHPSVSLNARIFDAGTGTALIPIEIARRHSSVQITASDLAPEMLSVARRNVVASGFSNSIQLEVRDCKQLPDLDASFDAVISNSLLHHIPTPARVFQELWRILKPGGLCFVRDLVRPETVAEREQLVDTYAGGESALQQQLLRQSLHAALTVEEVREFVRPLGIAATQVKKSSDRHWTLQASRPL